MWVLFEVGLVFSRMVVRDRARRAEEVESESAQDNAIVATAAAGASPSAEPVEEGEFRPLDEQEMEDEFDRIEREFDELETQDREEDSAGQSIGDGDADEESADRQASASGWTADDSADMLDEEEEFPARTATEALVDAKLEQVAALRAAGADDEARRLLYEVLAEGNETQVRVARNILEQLDN
jgi:sec-independent protein translocase protein TatC